MILTILSINSTFFKLEAQKLKHQINYKDSFKNIKKILKFFFFKPGAFSDKQFCKNYQVCNFFAT